MEICAAYTIPQLATMTGVNRFRMRRILDAASVPFMRRGRSIAVMATDLAEGLPEFWKWIARTSGKTAEREREETIRRLKARIKELECDVKDLRLAKDIASAA